MAADESLSIKTKVEAAQAKLHRAIEKSRLPGESYEVAATRFRGEKAATTPRKSQQVAMTRQPPKGDDQPDFFVPNLYDLGTRDSRSVMDVALYRLGKKDKRAGAVIQYDLSDGYVQVSSGPAGMASVWDYDIVLMGISHLTEAMNRYREGAGEKPGRTFRPNVAELLKFCRREQGGKQTEDLVESCLRLNTTHVAMQRTQKGSNGKIVNVAEGEPLISRYKITSNKAGSPESIEIELADWMYREVVDGKTPDVLTVHRDYFLIGPGIGRFLYRLARRAAGRHQAKWAFKTIFERSGSTGTLKKFAFALRHLIECNDMPEYELQEEAGQDGPLLIMTYRECKCIGSGS